jgi:hypothetical protein
MMINKWQTNEGLLIVQSVGKLSLFEEDWMKQQVAEPATESNLKMLILKTTKN